MVDYAQKINKNIKENEQRLQKNKSKKNVSDK